ncbi:MAG: lipocalin-like domain-containing protein [Gemmatimonadales bacterium]
MSRLGLVLLLTLGPASAWAQLPPSLVGAWRLVSFTRADATGADRPVWDDRPSGLIIYTADGHMAAQLYDARRPPLGVPRERAAPDAVRTAFAGLTTYFGTYTLDQPVGTVTHTVEGAMLPDWIGAKLVRAYRFLGPDRVELRVVTDAAGQRVADGAVLVWERAR